MADPFNTFAEIKFCSSTYQGCFRLAWYDVEKCILMLSKTTPILKLARIEKQACQQSIIAFDLVS